MDVHQVADPAALAAAIRAGMPYARALCGSVVPRSRLTDEPKTVNCPLCKQRSPDVKPETTPVMSSGWQSDDLGSDEDGNSTQDDFGDLDNDLDGFDPDGGWESADEDEVDDDLEPDSESDPESDSDPDPLAFIGVAFGALVPDGFEPADEWSRWMIPPSEDPVGPLLLKNRKVDLRQFVPESDLKFLQELGQLASMFGAENVASKMATVVHDLAAMAQTSGAKPLWRAKVKVKAKKAETDLVEEEPFDDADEVLVSEDPDGTEA